MNDWIWTYYYYNNFSWYPIFLEKQALPKAAYNMSPNQSLKILTSAKNDLDTLPWNVKWCFRVNFMLNNFLQACFHLLFLLVYLGNSPTASKIRFVIVWICRNWWLPTDNKCHLEKEAISVLFAAITWIHLCILNAHGEFPHTYFFLIFMPILFNTFGFA